MGEPYLWRTANMARRTCVVVKQIQSNPIQFGTELLQTHGPSPPRCNNLLWLNVLLAGDWRWRNWEPFYLPYHEPPLVVEWQRHKYSFLLDTKLLWHRWKWNSWPTGEGDPWPWHRSSGGCPLCRFETTGQPLHPAAGSNQVGCSCTWQRYLFRETNTGATEEIPALNQSWRGCNHPTSNWPYKGHQIPYLVPRTTRLLVPIVVKHWPLIIRSSSVQCYRNVVMNTTQLTHWIPPSLRHIPGTCIVEFLREVGFFYLIWHNLSTSTSPLDNIHHPKKSFMSLAPVQITR